MPREPMQIRLLFSGFHPLILEDSRLQIESQFRIETCGAEEDRLLEGIKRLRPHVLLLDLLHVSSLKTIERIKHRRPECQVIALTGLKQESVMDLAMMTSVSGLVYRADAIVEIPLALRTVLMGQRYMSPSLTLASTGVRGSRHSRSVDLARHHTLLLRLLAKRYAPPEIASALGLSVRMVRAAIITLKRQCGVRTTRDLQQYAETHAWASDLR